MVTIIQNYDYFQNIWKNKSEFFSKAQQDWNIDIKSFDQKNSFIQNIAATFQYIFCRDFIDVLRKWKKKLNTPHLYFTGGSALNISLNSQIIREMDFDSVFIPPCTNDTGLVIGAGACVENLKHGKIELHSPYITNWGLDNVDFKIDSNEIQKTAEFLLQNKVIGICNGNGEIGPRALGNRSIVSLANSKKLARYVSMQCKKREWYRPIAPIMLEKNAKFFTGKNNIHPLSKYMLLEFEVIPEKITEIEGAVHINGTSRIQTIFARDDNPFMYDLLEYLDVNYDVKGLINTSFNSKAQPIVHTSEDAMLAAKQMNLDGVVLNGKLSILKE